eukprot:6684577-Prymnesium_polylepis.1
MVTVYSNSFKPGTSHMRRDRYRRYTDTHALEAYSYSCSPQKGEQRRAGRGGPNLCSSLSYGTPQQHHATF